MLGADSEVVVAAYQRRKPVVGHVHHVLQVLVVQAQEAVRVADRGQDVLAKDLIEPVERGLGCVGEIEQRAGLRRWRGGACSSRRGKRGSRWRSGLLRLHVLGLRLWRLRRLRLLRLRRLCWLRLCLLRLHLLRLRQRCLLLRRGR